MNVSTDIGVWLAAFCTIAALSIAYKNTRLYRLAEYSLVGAAMGHYLVMAWNVIQKTAITPIMDGESIYILVIILGLLILTRLVRKYAWISRYPTGLLVGIGAGITLIPQFKTQLFGQIISNTFSLTGDPFTVVSNLIMTAGLIVTLLYFVFTFSLGKSESVVRKVIDRGYNVFLMVASGTMFIGMLFTVVAWLSGRIQFLIWQWLGIGAI